MARTLVLALFLCGCATLVWAQDFETLSEPYPSWLCSHCAEWNVPHEPFRIHGDTFYVGSNGLSSILITSPEGHVLIDGALPSSAPQILQNIRAVGFEPADVRLILNSHVHYDHAGGIAALQSVTGARVAASVKSAEVLERGRSGPDDPQYGTLLGFPPVPEVERFDAGDTLSVGAISLNSYATPGHTPGGTSWSWQSCDDDGCVNIVYADSLSPVSAQGFRFTDGAAYPDALAEFESGFAILEALDCDILVSTHPVSSSMWERYESGPGGLIDEQGCVKYVEAARRQVANRINREQESD
jgi:metallo-beta-lactamase class B